MPRNLDRRIKLMAPIKAPDYQQQLLKILNILFKDNVKARRLLADGTWRVAARPASDAPFIAQAALYEQVRRAWEKREAALPDNFEPLARGPVAGV